MLAKLGWKLAKGEEGLWIENFASQVFEGEVIL